MPGARRAPGRRHRSLRLIALLAMLLGAASSLGPDVAVTKTSDPGQTDDPGLIRWWLVDRATLRRIADRGVSR